MPTRSNYIYSRLDIYEKGQDTIIITTIQYTIAFPSVLKPSRPGRHLKLVILKRYLADTKICPVEVLGNYLKATKEIRNIETKLLISFLKQHSAVTVKTISRWMKTSLKEGGTDTNTFEGHSLFSSSFSKAKPNGANITQILNAGGWSNEHPFAKLYHRECINDKTIQDFIIEWYIYIVLFKGWKYNLLLLKIFFPQHFSKKNFSITSVKSQAVKFLRTRTVAEIKF